MNFYTIIKIKSNEYENRAHHLDILRGIIILLVLYHHSAAPFSYHVLQFHMPALFVLSGYTEHFMNKHKPFVSYVKSKFSRLIVPYLCFEIANLLLFSLITIIFRKQPFSLGTALSSIILCINNSYLGLYGRLWFLPAIFIASIFAYLAKHVSKNHPLLLCCCSLAFFALSYISSAVIPFRLPFTIDIAFLGAAFFLVGHICGNIITYIFDTKKHHLILISASIFATLFILCNKIGNPLCYMYINQYADFPLMVLCAISGTALIFIASKYLLFIDKIAFLGDVVLWYSINSLAVFPIHLTIKVLSIPILSKLGLNNWVSLLVIMFIFTIPLVNVVTNYFPFMLGSFKHNQTQRIKTEQ